jgi:hypothetical protein
MRSEPSANRLFFIVSLAVLFFISTPYFSLFAQEDNQPDIRDFLMRINKGKKYTSSREVVLEIKPKLPLELVQSMRVGLKSDLSDAKWVPMTPEVPVTLTSGDGRKTVYVMLKDKAGNNSAIQSTQIELDTKPPTAGLVTINDGDKYTNSPVGRVKLTISAEGAFKMQISNDGNFAEAKWEKYTEFRNWIVDTESDGTKKVFVRFGDRADNISGVYSDDIILDTTPPNGELSINDGEPYTTVHDVRLNVSSGDTDLEGIRITDGKTNQVYSFNASNSRSPMMYDWTLDSIEGRKYVRAYFRDHAGNINKQPAVGEIVLDTKPPERPLVLLNRGVKFVIDQEAKVDLQIKIRETPTGYTMRVSNSEDFKTYEEMAFKSSIEAWQLDAGDDGLKNVYVKLYDRAGNESDAGKGIIFLDRSIPRADRVVINSGAEYTSKPVVDLTIKAEGADLMQLSGKADFSNSTKWLPYKEQVDGWILTGEEGVNAVYTRFRDFAGNISAIVEDSIILQSKPPSGRIVLNEGNPVTNHEDRKVGVKLVYNSYAHEMMVSNKEDFSDAKWREVAESIEGWTLPGEKDGPKVVYAKFRNKAGVESSVAKDQILLDRTPPQNLKVAIDKGSKYCIRKDKKVMVYLAAEGAQFMRVGQLPELEEVEWEQYTPQKEITLEGEDGHKMVYVQFKDDHDNVTEIISDDIHLDRSPPEPRLFVIDDGSEWTNDPEKTVQLKIRADEAFQMRIDSDPDFKSSEWTQYKTVLDGFKLDGEDGLKSLYIVFRDDAGNISRPLSASIKLKRSF